MLQFFLELIIALLAVYGAYSALHELVALLEKIIQLKPSEEDGRKIKKNRKEDSHGGAEESGRTDHIGRND